MTPLPWEEVKRRALKHRADLVESLVTADLDEVPERRIEIRTIDRFIAWFEAGAPDRRMIGEVAQPPGY